MTGVPPDVGPSLGTTAGDPSEGDWGEGVRVGD